MMNPIEPWSIRDTEFPETGRDADKLQFCVGYAVLAPSSHNSQPWLFVLKGNQLDLVLDRSRALPAVDPENRELTISCGAALFNLCTALRFFGSEPEVDRFPDPRRPDIAASVRLGPPRPRRPAIAPLFLAITRRRTHRGPFQDREISRELIHALQLAAESEGGWLLPVEALQRDALAALIMEADRLQSLNPQFRSELASWMRPNRSERLDGIPGQSLGLRDLESRISPLVIRTFDLGDGTAARDHQLSLGSPLLAVLGTQHESPMAWLRAGEALEHVLLLAEAEGIAASFLNQPVEVPQLRDRLSTAIDLVDKPQLVLRMGYCAGDPATPRRPVGDVLRSA